MRRNAWLLAFILSVTLAGVGVVHAKPEPIIITTSRVPLDFDDAVVDEVGALKYRGGLALTSQAEDFGGLSAILVSPDGGTLTAVSDAGYLLSADLTYDETGQLSDVGAATLTLLPGLASLDAKKWRDAEALAPAADGGFLVSFEREHRIWRYDGATGEPMPIEAPAEIIQALANSGMEAMTRLADGRLFVITEGLYQGDGVAAWVGAADGGDWQQLTYATSQGYQPTGAATLPNGDVVVVERRFPLISVRIRQLAATDIVADATVEPVELARLEGSLAIDNFEGIDARRGAEGETLIYLLSDDNFRAAQNTYLLMFQLAE